MTRAAAALALTTAIQIGVALAALTVPAISPAVARDLAVPTSMIGSYVSALYFGAAIAALIGGGLVLRLGAIRLSQLGLLLCGLGLALGLVPSLAVVAAAAILVGIGYGPITPASSHVLARTATPQNIALTLSIKQTGVPAGMALAGIVVPPLAVAFGWRIAVLTVALACGAIALAAQALRSELDADRDRSARMSLRQMLAGLRLVAATPRLRTVATVSFVYSGMQMCTSGFIVAYLVEEVGVSLVAAGVALTTASVAGVVARIAWGALADRWLSPRDTLALIGALTAVLSCVVALFSGAWPFAAMLVVLAGLGATAIGWNGVYLAEVARVAPPGQAGLATGGCLFFTFVGVVVCPPLFGWAQHASGRYAVSFAAAALACAGVALWLFAGRRPRQAGATAP
ncbi:MAG: MFS transporter [Gemmatimonadota bacterium]